MSGRVSVFLVDDSPLYLEALAWLLSEAGDFDVVGTASNGREAVEALAHLSPDVIAMDVRMPVMDGLAAVEEIMSTKPTPILLLTGDVDRQGARWSFEALSRGALDLLPKPTLSDAEARAGRRFCEHLRFLSTIPVVHHPRRTRRPAAVPGVAFSGREGSAIACVVASTGGPAVIAELLGALPADFPLPVLLVQHLAKGFAPHLVRWLAGAGGPKVVLAADGDRPLPGTVYVAPDDGHLIVEAGGRLRIDREGPPFEGHRPSGTVLLASVARVHGPHAVGLILTGMGSDGAEGLEALHRSGGLCFAQDEATSTVYGMAHAAVARGAVSRQIPRAELACALREAAVELLRREVGHR